MGIKFENTVTPSPEQWRSIILATRNPMNSWEKSDSEFSCPCKEELKKDDIRFPYCLEGYKFDLSIGPNDHDLMTKLCKAGTDHRKFMRMITVYVDITASLYWWKEFDTYKVGTVANSCSTMHKIHAKEFTLEDFSCEHLIGEYDVCDICTDDYDGPYNPKDLMHLLIDMLNEARDLFLETKDKKYWWQMIQLLPSSYNQKRTVMLNYEVLANIYKSRKNHKLDEWAAFCQWIETLPYSGLITGGNEQ